MINQTRYTKNLVLGEQLLKDTGNKFVFINQRKATVNTDDGEKKAVSVTLQITEDNSEPLIDKKTGEVKGNNVLENMSATIIDATYPLPFKKGDIVALENFDEKYSFFFDFNLIMRFHGIKLLKSATPQGQPQGGISHAISGQTK